MSSNTEHGPASPNISSHNRKSFGKLSIILRETGSLGKQNKCMAMNLNISNYTYGPGFGLAMLHKDYKMEILTGNY